MVRALPLLALAACGCPDVGLGPVSFVGEPPAGADVVVAVAQERCAVSGTVTWVEGPFECGWDGRPCSGVQRSDRACEPLDAVVSRREPATSSALAHELGHYCLGDEESEALDAWASEVNTEAARRM